MKLECNLNLIVLLYTVIKLLFIKLNSVNDTGGFSFHSGGHNRIFRCSCWPTSWGNFDYIPSSLLYVYVHNLLYYLKHYEMAYYLRIGMRIEVEIDRYFNF